ncbi:HK97-gp10 family putative phage morphogenesis protein [Fructilactobacillus sp. Tb1]|uniref:HK97-gp10 family putative phage morphogenesis protein n=1 Tax=Fructilactobacillus sp. Tb1 TaxID=3422304 RepID=UPI003D2E6A4D
MSEIDDQLQNLCKAIKNAVPDVEKQAKITNVGAKVYEKVLKDNTPFNPHHVDTSKASHLRDSIVVQAKNMDGVVDGSNVVGFDTGRKTGINHDRIAMFSNNGTAKAPNPKGKNFVDKSIEQAKPDVYKAMESAWHNGMNGGGND